MRITVVSCNGWNNISRIKRLEKIFRIGCVTVTRLATVQAIAKFRKIYLFGFHKIQTSCRSYRRILSIRIAYPPRWSRFAHRQSISRARNFYNSRARLSIMELKADCLQETSRLINVIWDRRKWHHSIFFSFSFLFYYVLCIDRKSVV